MGSGPREKAAPPSFLPLLLPISEMFRNFVGEESCKMITGMD